MENFEIIQGGVTSPKGFKAAGAHVGLRRKRKDLALLLSETPCDYSAVFTTNTAKGAPILWNKEVVASGKKVRALVVNSGNANSCTGYPGLVHAKQMAETTATCFSLEPHEVLVASTGIIGVPLQIDKVKAGIRTVASILTASQESGTMAAEAITTTDNFIKQMALQFEVDGTMVTMGAMAKGSGMVHPNMATMLSFITTDLAIAPHLLEKAFKGSVSKTYNMISIDGDTSTNDMSAILANGMAGNAAITEENADYELFVSALHYMNTYLAKQIARDGEGASKLIEVTVCGATTQEDADKLARIVVSSNLVKTAFFAQDANWGRIVAAMGSSGLAFDENKLNLYMSGTAGDGEELEVCLLLDGTPYWTDDSICKAVLSENEIKVKIELNMGEYSATSWGCDLTYEYIRKNGNYKNAYVADLAANAKEGVA